MTSEQLLDLMEYLPDEAILRADPANFSINKKPMLRRILTYGGIVAAVVLGLTVGLMRFLPTQPDGDPSVQLPPTVTATDTDTQTTTNDTSASTEDGLHTPMADPPPHLHYKGKVYYPNGKVIVVEELPKGAYYIGEGNPYSGCIGGAQHSEEDLCGNLIGPLYISEDQMYVYFSYSIKSDGTLNYQQLSLVIDE